MTLKELAKCFREMGEVRTRLAAQADEQLDVHLARLYRWEAVRFCAAAAACRELARSRAVIDTEGERMVNQNNPYTLVELNPHLRQDRDATDAALEKCK